MFVLRSINCGMNKGELCVVDIFVWLVDGWSWIYLSLTPLYLMFFLCGINCGVVNGKSCVGTTLVTDAVGVLFCNVTLVG